MLMRRRQVLAHLVTLDAREASVMSSMPSTVFLRSLSLPTGRNDMAAGAR